MVDLLDRDWRCTRCGALLGVLRAGRIHLKYKAAQYMVEGKVAAVCHRCGELCVTMTATATTVAGTTVAATTKPTDTTETTATARPRQDQDARSLRP
jgi:hypothetical protein